MDNGTMEWDLRGTKYSFAIRVHSPSETMTFHQDKEVLCRHSEVFSKMIHSDFKESSEGQVTITDFQPLTVHFMLRFLNSGKLAVLNWIELVDLVKLAHHFQVNALIEACEKRLSELLNLENVYTNMNLASLLSLETLRKRCLEVIAGTAFVSFCRPGFVNLGRQEVLDIVSTDGLILDTEMTMVNALWRWGQWECCRQGLSLTDQNICTTLGELTAAVCHMDLKEHEINQMQPALKDILAKNESRSKGITFNREWCLLPHSSSITLKGDCVRNSNRKTLCLIRFTLTKPAFLTGVQLEYSDMEFHCCPGFNTLSLYEHTSNGLKKPATKILFGAPKKLLSMDDYFYMKVCATFVPPVHLTASSILQLHTHSYEEFCDSFTWAEMKVPQLYTKCLDDSNELLLPVDVVRGVKKLYIITV